MLNLNSHVKGNISEEKVLKHLKKQGYKLLQKNYRFGRYEIDLIVQKKGHIAFVEVKSEKENSPWPSDLKVNYKKRQNIIKTARQFLREYGEEINYSFDIARVIECKNKVKLEYIKNAFDKMGSKNILFT